MTNAPKAPEGSDVTATVSAGNVPVAAAAPAVPNNEANAAMYSQLDQSGIITDSKKLSGFIGLTLKNYQNSGTQVHVAMVSALWNFAKSGNPVLLQRLFDGLRPNDQGAVKAYIRRMHAVIGLSMGDADHEVMVPGELAPKEEIQAAIQAGTVLNFTKGTFVTVLGHTTPQAKFLVKLCETHLIHPDGVDFKAVLDRSNISESQLLGDIDVLERILKAAKAATNNNGRTETHISSKTKTFLEKITNDATAMRDQFKLAKVA